MILLAPAALLGLAAVPLVLLFYLLRVRLRTTEVSSTYLWQRLLRDLAAQDPWQKPRFTVLMLIQMLLLAVLALAMAKPALPTITAAADFAVIVLDVSASMQATDVQPSRFSEAQRQAAATIRQLPDGSTVAIIAAGSRPSVMAAPTQDREAALSALYRVQPGGTELALEPALRLATAVASSQSRARVHLFTDGAYDATGLPDIPNLYHHIVPGSKHNQAITALAVRADAQNNRRHQLFARLANFSDQPEDVTLGLYADGNLVDSRNAQLAAASVQDLIVDRLPDGVSVVSARLLDGDALAVDNAANVVIERRHPTRILLVSGGNLFLQHALALLPNVELSGATPNQYPGIATEQYDIIVFDGYLPENPPPQNILAVNPPDSALLPVEGTFAPGNALTWQVEHPLLQYVTLGELRIQRAEQISAPGWLRVVAQANGWPLLLAGERDGRRLIVVAYDLRQSNLPLLAAFPILMANSVGYLEPSDVVDQPTVQTGRPVVLRPMAQAEEIEIQRPDGGIERFGPGRDIVYAGTDLPGVYRVRQFARESVISSAQFAANLSNAAESDISSRPVAGGQPAEIERGEPQLVQREIWPWLVIAGLGVLGVEWWWYHRRA